MLVYTQGVSLSSEGIIWTSPENTPGSTGWGIIWAARPGWVGGLSNQRQMPRQPTHRTATRYKRLISETL